MTFGPIDHAHMARSYLLQLSLPFIGFFLRVVKPCSLQLSHLPAFIFSSTTSMIVPFFHRGGSTFAGIAKGSTQYSCVHSARPWLSFLYCKSPSWKIAYCHTSVPAHLCIRAAIDETWSLRTELKQIYFTGQSEWQKVQVTANLRAQLPRRSPLIHR